MALFERLTSVLFAALMFLLSLFMSPDHANAEEGYARAGGYFQVGALGAAYTKAEDEVEDATGGNADTDTTAGFQLVGGLRAGAHLAFELEFEYLAPSDIDVFGRKIAEIETLHGSLNMKFYPLRERIQPYGLVGAGLFRAEISESGGSASDDFLAFALRFGGGLDFYLTEQFFLNAGAEYVLPTGTSADDLDYVSFGAGVGYRF